MQRVYHERDMDEPLIVRGLLQWLGVVAFFLVRYVLDVLLTPEVVDDTVRGAWRGGRAALATAWPLLCTCYAPLAPVLLIQVWRLATLDMVQWTCGCVCSFRLMIHLLMHDSLIVGSLTKRDVWPQIVPFVTFVRVSSGRARRVLGKWQHGPRYFLCRAMPWAVRVCLLALLLRRSLPNYRRTRHRNGREHPAVADQWATGAGEEEHDGLVARISSCYDGDTCYAAELTWRGSRLPPIFGHNMKVRLLGLDTPELRTNCALERCLAMRAKAVLEDFVATNEEEHRLVGCVRDKYFRVTCDIVSSAGESAADAMLSSGLAVEYHGQTKVFDWCRPRESPSLRPHLSACR